MLSLQPSPTPESALLILAGERAREYIHHAKALNTIRAYRETNYNVHDAPGFALNVGVVNLPLRELYAARGIASCAYVTACNPYSQLLSAKDNLRREKALARKLQPTLPSQDPVGIRPGISPSRRCSQRLHGAARPLQCSSR